MNISEFFESKKTRKFLIFFSYSFLCICAITSFNFYILTVRLSNTSLYILNF